MRTAARGWFMLRHFGAEQVAILDGGFQKWLAEGRPTESGEPAPRDARVRRRRAPDEVVTKQQILAGARLRLARCARQGPLRRQRARSAARESRPATFPGARNLPFAALYNDGWHLQVGRTSSARLFAEAGIDPAQPFVASCGSGVTANSLIFAAHLLGNDAATALRWQLERMGRRPGDPEGDRARPKRG